MKIRVSDWLWIVGTALLGASVCMDGAEWMRKRRNWDRAVAEDIASVTSDGVSGGG